MADKPVTQKDIKELNKRIDDVLEETVALEVRCDTFERDLEKKTGNLDDRLRPTEGMIRVLDKEADELENRLDKRLTMLERRADPVDKRFDEIDKRLDRMEKTLDEVTQTLVQVAVKARPK